MGNMLWKQVVKRIALLMVFMLAASSFVCLLPAKAEGVTIVVPDDYGSIGEAFANARDGDIVFVKKGTYDGPENQTITINKSLTIVGEDPNTTIVNFLPPLVPMAIFTYEYLGYTNPLIIQADGVKITGLTLKTPGGSILTQGQTIELENDSLNTALIINGNNSKIVNNTFSTQSYSVNIYSAYCNIANNTLNGVNCHGAYNVIATNYITGSQNEGLIQIEGISNIVYSNQINGNGWYGIQVNNANETIIAKNDITGCYGIRMEKANNSNVCANSIIDYSGIDLVSGNGNKFYGNQLENNTLGIRLGFDQTDTSRKHGSRTANNIVFHNNFIDNKEQALDWNWLGTNQWDKDGEGNYWSDYNGIDWTFDGIGDSPYKLEIAKSFYAEATQSQDNHPLTQPYDVNTVEVLLPEWAQYSETPSKKMDNPFPTALTATAAAMSVALITLVVYRAKTRKNKRTTFGEPVEIKSIR
jgi:hypothetical protein